MAGINLGYTGQRRSRVCGNYQLGNGYRGFNPILKRFVRQDDISPFGAGGGHGFTYCKGNPINSTDTSGHGVLVDLIIALSTYGLQVTSEVDEAFGAIFSAAEEANANVHIREGNLIISGGRIGKELTTQNAIDMRDEIISRYVKDNYSLKFLGSELRESEPEFSLLNPATNEIYFAKARFDVTSGHISKINMNIYSWNRNGKIINIPSPDFTVDFISRQEERLEQIFTQRNAPPSYRDALKLPPSYNSFNELPSYDAAVGYPAVWREVEEVRDTGIEITHL